MGRMDNKVAIITGAARGIGAAAARLFAAEGAKLMLADVLTEPLDEVTKEIGANAATCPTDVTDEAAMKMLVDETVKRWSKVDAALLNEASKARLPPSRAIRPRCSTAHQADHCVLGRRIG